VVKAVAGRPDLQPRPCPTILRAPLDAQPSSTKPVTIARRLTVTLALTAAVHSAAQAQQMITQMGLGHDQRQRAIELFRRGAAPDFQMEPVVATFVQTCGGQLQIQRTLLLFLISLAQADRGMEPAEHAALVRIAGVMGIGAAQLELLLRRTRAQEQFQGRSGPETPRATSLADAYSALGVDSSVSDKELKRAYRRLMSENHPDKLIAKGVPEAMIKLATVRTQEIQSAYEMLKKSRPAMR